MNIHQEVTIEASPAAIYGVLTSSHDFTRMTGGMKAEISSEVGGAFSVYGGDVQGRNVELVPGKRVVQAWRNHKWPEGVYSLVRFELMPEGKGTRIIFDQVGHPASSHETLEGGWPKAYWQPMKAMLVGK